MNLPRAKCAGAMRALRLHTTKCSMANAFLIRLGGLACRLKRKGPGAQETESERRREKRERKNCSGRDRHPVGDFAFALRLFFYMIFFLFSS